MLNIFKKKIISIFEAIHLKIFGHEMSEEMRRFVENLGWTAFGMGISMILLFFVNLVAARLLGPVEYGKYALIISVGQLFLIPMLFGFNTAAIKYVAENPNKKNLPITIIYSVLFFTIVSAGLLILFKDHLAPIIKIDNAMYLAALIYGFILSIKYVYEALLRGVHNFKSASLFDILNSVVIALTFFAYLFFVNEYTFKNYIIAIIAGLIAYIIFSFFKTQKSIKGQNFEINDFKKLLRYGGYATIGSVAGFIIGNANQFVLNNYLGLSTVGLFAVYSSASLFLTGQLINIFVNVFFPTFSRDSNNKEVFKKLIKLFRITFLPLIIFNVVVIIVIVFFYGHQYELNLMYALLFSINAVISFFYQILLWMNNSKGISGIRSTVIISSFSSIIFLIFTFILTNRFEIYGAISASIIMNFVLYYVFRKIMIKRYT